MSCVKDAVFQVTAFHYLTSFYDSQRFRVRYWTFISFTAVTAFRYYLIAFYQHCADGIITLALCQ